MNRRKFLRASTAVAVPFFSPGLSLGNPANSRLQHACIGVGGMGWGDLQSLSSHPQLEVTALCDVDSANLRKAAEKFPKARKYRDWRELLEVEGGRIDSVNVTVPDHMHAPISMEAMHRGKHVYCQKPLTHEVAEARAMRLCAERAGVVTQMGNQIQSAVEYQMAVRMLKDGVVGKIREIHAWSGAKFPQRGRPEGSDPVPDTLDWNLWLGGAPERPFKTGIYHPFNWRGWQDFGGGAIGDFGCHILDTPFKAVELTAPMSITAKVPKPWADNPAWHTENWPDWESFEYIFPGTKYTEGEAIKVTWYDGDLRPPRELFGFENEKREIPGGGSLFIGEGGNFLVPHIAGPQLVPYKLNRGIKRPDVKGFSHYHAFVDACLGKGETGSNFGFAGPLSETVLLGNIANRFPGQRLDWDAEKMLVTNVLDANRYVSRSYRSGFAVAGL